MFQQPPQSRQRLSRGLVVVLTVLALGANAMPATARQDPGPAVTRVGHLGECALQRVGTQYVKCDFSTGNGVPAPAWVPVR